MTKQRWEELKSPAKVTHLYLVGSAPNTSAGVGSEQGMRVKHGHWICLPQAWVGWWESQALNLIRKASLYCTCRIYGLSDPEQATYHDWASLKLDGNNNTFIHPVIERLKRREQTPVERLVVMQARAPWSYWLYRDIRTLWEPPSPLLGIPPEHHLVPRRRN